MTYKGRSPNVGEYPLLGDLIEGEEQFQLLLEHSPDAVFIMDPHHPDIPWRILACNDVACHMNGYSMEELVGQSLHILDPGGQEWIDDTNFLERLRREGAAYGVTPHRRKDGTLFYIEFSTSLITVGGRELALGVDRDITERLRTEEALRHTRDELELRVQRRTAELARANDQLRVELTQRERAERRLAAQYAISQVLAEADHFMDAAPRILQVIGETQGWPLGQLWCVDADGGVLRWSHTWCQMDGSTEVFEASSRGMAIEPGVGLPGRVWAQREPYWIEDLSQATNLPRRHEALQAGLRGAFAFPLQSQTQFFGVMEFFSPELRAPDVPLLQMVAVIGYQTGEYIERRRAETALRASEARKTAMLDGALDCIITMDGDGRVVEWNPAAEATFGYTRAVALGQNMADLIIPPELREAHWKGLTRYLSTGETRVLGKRFETRAIREGGGEFAIELTIVRIPAPGPPLFTAFARDITQRKREEAQTRFLNEASALLATSLDYETTLENVARLVVPELADWCFVDLLDDDGSFRRLAVAHRDPAQVELAGGLRRAYRPFQNAEFGVSKVVQTGEPEVLEDVPEAFMAGVARDSEHLHMLRALNMRSYICVPLRARGRTIGAMTFILAEGARRYTRENLPFALELAHRAGLAVDNARLFEAERRARGEAEVASEMVRRLQSVTDAALTHLTLDDLLHELLDRVREILVCDTAAMYLVEEDGQHLTIRATLGLEAEMEHGIRLPVGHGIAGRIAATRAPMIVDDLRTVEVASPVLIEHCIQSLLGAPLMVESRVIGVLHVGTLQERHFSAEDVQLLQFVADRAALAIDHARLYLEAQEGVRMRDEFLSIAAHELKTPITSLLGFAQVLQRRAARDQASPDRDQRALQVIVEQADRLSRLVGILLDLSRIETGNLQLNLSPVDLTRMAHRLVDELRPGLTLHTVNISTPEGDLIVEGDELRLEQAVRNLLQNAVKYSPDGGLITLHVQLDGDWVVISIADQGLGIPAAAQSQLFQRFYRGDHAHGSQISGFGIGLYVVKEIVTRHGGAIDVQSAEGQGSTFTIRLPRHQIKALS